MSFCFLRVGGRLRQHNNLAAENLGLEELLELEAVIHVIALNIFSGVLGDLDGAPLEVLVPRIRGLVIDKRDGLDDGRWVNRVAPRVGWCAGRLESRLNQVLDNELGDELAGDFRLTVLTTNCVELSQQRGIDGD